MAKVVRLGEQLKVSTLGTIDFVSLAAERKREQAQWLEENKPRLIAEYGVTAEFDEDELLKLRDYEKSKSICESCAGLPCTKRKSPTIKETIKVNVAQGEIEVREGTCEYEKARRRLERIKRSFKSSKMSADYLNKGFSDYEVDAENAQAVKIAHKILQGEERGAYFYGAYGAGKTFLAAIMASEFVQKGVSVLFYKVPFLVKDLQDAQFDKTNPFKESELLKQICEVPVLILDDFGMSGKVSTYAAGRLSMIIDARYEDSRLCTVITSNLSLKKLQEKLDKPSDAKEGDFTLDGSRIADRIKGMCAVVKFGGGSRRWKK